MRLWSLHPRYLDPKGLVALWREALLAQAVLRGETRGYRNHPQLDRFRAAPGPAPAVAAYLRVVQAEAARRGYRFDPARIGDGTCAPLPVPFGQLAYEREHLLAKLRLRAPDWLEALERDPDPEPHPLFRLVPGGIAPWEAGAFKR
jgi:hypothetical protein